MIKQYIKDAFSIEEKVYELIAECEKKVSTEFKKIDQIKELNQYKVIQAMQKHHLSDTHFGGTTGYGYDDRGRDVLDLVYQDVFHTEDALVRHHMVSGTQAIATALFGCLRPEDELLSITGKPYDTLEEVIGIRGTGNGSLKDFGVSYRQVDLLEDEVFDKDLIKKAIHEKTKVVFMQKSRGYMWRGALTIPMMKEAISYVKSIKEDVLVVVDNCYGEFVETMEPTDVGADLIAGSLIKNPGGGLALTGGYIAGKQEWVQKAAYRLTTPGLGKKVGASLGNNRWMFQGLFMAPHVVAESLKGAVLTAAVMEALGFKTSPSQNATRGDLIQAIRFEDSKKLIAFCQGIQKGSPVDSFVTPEPWDMPGYDSEVIMAAGAFVQGSSIELSADAPIKPPYIAYLQGGLVYEHVKLGIMMGIQYMNLRS
jgi:cystathionine beta-lyase family protein involved in aluminum resistance